MMDTEKLIIIVFLLPNWILSWIVFMMCRNYSPLAADEVWCMESTDVKPCNRFIMLPMLISLSVIAYVTMVLICVLLDFCYGLCFSLVAAFMECWVFAGWVLSMFVVSPKAIRSLHQFGDSPESIKEIDVDSWKSLHNVVAALVVTHAMSTLLMIGIAYANFTSPSVVGRKQKEKEKVKDVQ